MSGEDDEDLEPSISPTTSKSEENASSRCLVSGGIGENARLLAQAAALLQDEAYAKELSETERPHNMPW